jgi:hypothetical protein
MAFLIPSQRLDRVALCGFSGRKIAEDDFLRRVRFSISSTQSPTSRDPVLESCISRSTSCLRGRNPHRHITIKGTASPAHTASRTIRPCISAVKASIR